MLKHYFTTALRNFRKNQFYTLVNILGLSIGITCCLVVYSIMRYELRFDSFHKKKESIYRIVEHRLSDYGIQYKGVLPNAMGAELADAAHFGDQIIPMNGPQNGTIEFDFESRHLVFKEEAILFTNSNFLKHLDFKIVRGATNEALDEPFKIFLTERKASQYFGRENPIGRVLTINEFVELEVVGVLENPPSYTNTPFDMVISQQTMPMLFNDYVKSWDAYWTASAYFVANEGERFSEVEKRMTAIAHQHFSSYVVDRTSFHLQPLAEVHTDSRYEQSVTYVSPKEVVIGFVLLAVITLTASILNFVNLSTALAVQRSKEVGIKKTLGSGKRNLMAQFIGETAVIVTVATLIAFTIGQFLMLQLNALLSVVRFDVGYDLSVILFSIGLGVVVSFLAGFYPAMIISGYNPIHALNNQVTLNQGAGKSFIRKGLVVFQFVIANLLIITTVIVAAQMHYVKNKDLGFNRENVLTIGFPRKVSDKMPTILNEYKALNFVEKASWCMAAPQANIYWGSNYQIEGTESSEDMHMNIKFIDDQYLDLYEVPLITGRNIANRYNSTEDMLILVNREFLKRAGVAIEEAVGLNVKFNGNWKGEIIGVVEDYHAESLQNKIVPVLLAHMPGNMNQINLQLNTNDFQAALPEMEKVFRQFAPKAYFEARFVNDVLVESYIVENLIYTVFQFFAVLAILIGVFGLYGLVSFMAARNRKSISIRKVFGASITNILRAFSSDIAILMTVAFIIAAPCSYLLCQQWLNGFEYQISISAMYFLLSFGVTVLITLTTVGRKSLSIAKANPIDALRYQ